MKPLHSLLLLAPDDHLDASMIELVKGWSDPPTPLQILEVLDKCTNYALASDLAMNAILALYHEALDEAEMQHEDLLSNAIWRSEGL